MVQRKTSWFVWSALATLALGCGGSQSDGQAGAGDAGPEQQAAKGPPPLVQDLTITDVALFQANKALLAKDGAKPAKANAPVIADRAGLLRVYVKPADGWSPREVQAELRLSSVKDGKDPARSTRLLVKGPSSDDAQGSTFDFLLDATDMPEGVNYSVAIREVVGTSESDDAGGARYPADGSLASLDARALSTIKIKLVPFEYDADGSGRTPDTSAAQVERYRSTIFKMYPTAKVDVTVRESVPWRNKIDPFGAGWDEVINEVMSLRQTDGAPDDVYYVGTFAPASSLGAFCNQGCILGVGTLASPSDVAERFALIVGYPGQVAADTLNQELAHAMGREHAPCGGAAGPDPKYPYAKATIGNWGYDIIENTWIDPTSKYRDFMSYCTPIWVSDYTFNGLYGRISYVNRPKREMPPQDPMRYRVVHVQRDGALRVGTTLTLREKPGGEMHSVRYLARDGRSVQETQGYFYAYDQLPGGHLLVPEGPIDATTLQIRNRAVALPH